MKFWWKLLSFGWCWKTQFFEPAILIFFCFIPMKISHKLCVRMVGTQFFLLWWFTAKNKCGNDKRAWVYDVKKVPHWLKIGIVSENLHRMRFLEIFLQIEGLPIWLFYYWKLICFSLSRKHTAAHQLYVKILEILIESDLSWFWIAGNSRFWDFRTFYVPLIIKSNKLNVHCRHSHGKKA